MKIKKYTLVIVLALFATSCYMPISGRVIDADTKQPVEGAVVLVEWTKTIGIGLTRTESYKVAETLSDKEGRFDLPGCYSPFVNEPNITVYKRGYVAWNSSRIFPDNQRRTDYSWRNSSVYILNLFKEMYSFDKHYYFIMGAANLESSAQSKKLFIEAYDRWERGQAIRERGGKRLGGGSQ